MMARVKRRSGDGSWKRTASGWEYRRMIDGEIVSASGRTQGVARERMDEKVARLKEGLPLTDARTTLGELLNDWKGAPLDARTTKRRGPMKETTKEQYRAVIVLYIVGRTDPDKPERQVEADRIASVRLDRLKPAHVSGLIARLRERKLAESTIRTTYHVLRLALDYAVDNDMLTKNPAAKVDRPGTATEEARHLSPAEVMRLLDAAKEYRYHEALALIAGTGMRRGEALALRWDDVDLVAGCVNVRGTLSRIKFGGEERTALTVTPTKTRRSTRTVYLSPALVDMLALMKDRQEVAAKALRGVTIVRGEEEVPAWTDTGFCFTTDKGQPVDPRNVFRTLQQAAKKAKLSGVGVHTLRHSWASAALDSGEQIANVSETLGHSDVRITQVYTHTNDPSKRLTAVNTASLFGL